MSMSFDLKAFQEACAKDVAEGKRPAVGSKVRVLKAARPQYQETIVGRIAVVATHCLDTQGFVNFKKVVTVEYPWAPGGQVVTESVFDVAEWEPVPDDTPLGPERHDKFPSKEATGWREPAALMVIDGDLATKMVEEGAILQ